MPTVNGWLMLRLPRALLPQVMRPMRSAYAAYHSTKFGWHGLAGDPAPPPPGMPAAAASTRFLSPTLPPPQQPPPRTPPAKKC